MRKVGSGSSQQINKALERGAHRLENNDWLPRSQIQHCCGWTSEAADRCWEGVNPGLGEDRGKGSSSTAACQGVERGTASRAGRAKSQVNFVPESTRIEATFFFSGV